VTDRWTIAVGDNFEFDIVPAGPRDGLINGVYPTKLDALEAVSTKLGQTRLRLTYEISRANRLIRQEKRRRRPA
jgi:hypothetical protein